MFKPVPVQLVSFSFPSSKRFSLDPPLTTVTSCSSPMSGRYLLSVEASSNVISVFGGELEPSAPSVVYKENYISI